MDIQLPDFTKARVLVVGDLMLDRYWYGAASRISPEAPVPVLPVKRTEERPGGAGNVAVNLAALGVQVTLMGVTGDDAESHQLEELLEARGIDCDFERIFGLPTITKLRVLSQHQQLIRLDFEDGFMATHTEALYRRYAKQLADFDAVILSDYNKGTLNECSQLIKAARKAKVPVFVDPKNLDFTFYRGAFVLTPNMKEFETAVGGCGDDLDVMQAKAEKLRKQCNLDALLVTRSEKGMSLFIKDEAPYHIPTRAKEVFDVTGAGDTVIATLCAAYVAGCPLPIAMRIANIAAGISVGKLGAATVTVPELQRVIHALHYDGVLTEDQLVRVIKTAQANGEKVVMTNGCFDILHAGHVHYLEEAKQLGDRLVVAVNDDDSVRRLKGEDRPINQEKHRMAVLAGLASVDWVVKFSEDTPKRLIDGVLPDVLVKGGDWSAEQIVGSDAVLANGGEVHSLNFVDGLSTTNVVDKIIKRGEK